MRIVAMRLQGLSLTEISRLLNAEGIPTPMGRPHWLKSYVDRVLHTRYVKDIIDEMEEQHRAA